MPDKVSCSQPKPTDHPTPYGEYICVGGYWQWQESYGRRTDKQKDKNKKDDKNDD